MNAYYPDYKPHDETKFSQMLKMFRMAAEPNSLTQIMMLYVMDTSYHREDITVAIGRIEREKGWKLQ